MEEIKPGKYHSVCGVVYGMRANVVCVCSEAEHARVLASTLNAYVKTIAAQKRELERLEADYRVARNSAAEWKRRVQELEGRIGNALL